MIRIFQKKDNAINDVERIIIDGTTAIHERIMLSETKVLQKHENLKDIWCGVVWKTWSDDIITDYKWESVEDYIKWIKQLRFKETEELETSTIELNNKTYKKYINLGEVVAC